MRLVQCLEANGERDLSPASSLHIILLYLIALGLTRRMPLGCTVRILQLFAIFAIVYHRDQLPLADRQHDIDGHLAHIALVATGNLVPDSKACWECFQPPVYYWLAGLGARGAELLGIDTGAMLQFGGMALMVIFQSLGLKLIGELLTIPWVRAAGSVLLLLWPSTVFHARRISNDQLVWIVTMLAFIAFFEYRKRGAPRALRMTLALCALAVFVKLNALVAFAYVAIVLFADSRTSSRSLLEVAGALVLTLSATYALTLAKGGGVGVSASHLPRGQYIGTSAEQFLALDMPTYFTPPDTDTLHDAYGRRYFWNYLLKTSLWGEWKVPAAARGYAAAANASLLVLLAAALLPWLARSREMFPRFGTLLALLALHVSSLVVLRLVFPFSPHQDFRFMYAALPFVAILLCGSLELPFLSPRGELLRRAITLTALGVLCVCGQIVVFSHTAPGTSEQRVREQS